MLPKLGVIAGGGQLPARIVDHCRRQGRDLFVIALEGQADPQLVEDVAHEWVRLGAGGKTLEILRREAVAEVIMAGAVRRPSLTDLRPDLWTAGFLARSGAVILGDDGLLRAIVRELEARAVRVVGIDDVLPDVLAPAGCLGRLAPDEEAQADIARALSVARGIGALDVGQAAVVQQGIVLAVEAAEGTAAMLARCHELARPGPGGVLVKAKKPGQDRRADLPTIGPDTVRAAAAAGLRGIAVEAGSVLILDRMETVAAADAADLFLVGLTLPPDNRS
jgi:DUF1009 family protein